MKAAFETESLLTSSWPNPLRVCFFASNGILKLRGDVI